MDGTGALQGVGTGVRVELPWQGYASNSMVSFDSINDNGGGQWACSVSDDEIRRSALNPRTLQNKSGMKRVCSRC